MSASTSLASTCFTSCPKMFASWAMPGRVSAATLAASLLSLAASSISVSTCGLSTVGLSWASAVSKLVKGSGLVGPAGAGASLRMSSMAFAASCLCFTPSFCSSCRPSACSSGSSGCSARSTSFFASGSSVIRGALCRICFANVTRSARSSAGEGASDPGGAFVFWRDGDGDGGAAARAFSVQRVESTTSAPSGDWSWSGSRFAKRRSTSTLTLTSLQLLLPSARLLLLPRRF